MGAFGYDRRTTAMPPADPQRTTLLLRDPSAGDTGRLSTALPPELLEQVRGRVRLIAALLTCAFALDPVVFLGGWATSLITGVSTPDGFFDTVVFQWIGAGGAVVSAGLWRAAGGAVMSPSRLHTAALLYEVGICLVIAVNTNWQHFLTTGTLPNLTWVPVVILLFPLIVPGPPRRMLAAAIAAGSTVPLGLLLLHRSGRVVADIDAYVQATVSSVIAIAFAYMGARVIYGLGRQLMAARELGSYQLEERLGEGGMGEVWRARHRMLVRRAAIKLIRSPSGTDAPPIVADDLRRRFEREAQAIASLRSPHTVTLFDFGVADGGTFYYAMELLDGIDADKLVRRFGPVPYERAVFVLRQVCHSLSEADARGLVHRDVKPANIFLCRYGEDVDFVKVLDFGLVTALGGTVEGQAALTRAHVVQGTPAFIAPEQALGRASLDGRADLYGLGCVAYWLLTGRQVFEADTPMGLILHHTRTKPDPPSSRTDLPIPADLDALVLACLAKEPDDRPTSARALSASLGAVAGAGAWTDNRARDWWQRHLPAGPDGLAPDIAVQRTGITP
jgi:serine/threonine-protein kinase